MSKPNENPTILMTGGTGFLGSHLIADLIERDYRIVLLKRRTSNTARITSLLPRLAACYCLEDVDIPGIFERHPIDLILHCATDYGRKNVDSLQLVEANLLLPLRLLQAGKRHGVKAFFNTDTMLDKRVNDYSLSKKQFKDWLELTSDELICVNVAIEHFYGPGDDKTKFVSWIVDGFLGAHGAIHLTAGEQKRDFIYIDDVVSAFFTIIGAALSAPPGFHHYEIGSGATVTIRQIVTLVAKLCEKPLDTALFGAVPYRPNEVMESKVNLAPLKALGWRPQVSLEDGLRQMIARERKRTAT